MPTVEEWNERQRAHWTSAAAYERWNAWQEGNLAEVTAWCCDATALAPGKVVLDVACGTGQPSLAAAQAVGPGGRVVATDIAPSMIEIAGRAARALGLGNIDFRAMDAQDLEFDSAAFDAITCRFGLMFCPEPGKALAELYRVLRPGGRLAISVWDLPAKNPFFTWMAKQIELPPPPDPNAPGLFRLAPPGLLEQMLRAAGFKNVSVVSRPIMFECASAEEYWDAHCDLAEPVKAAVAKLTAAEVELLKAKTFAAIAPYVRDGRVRMPAASLCATAEK